MILPPPPGEPNAGFPFQLYPGYPTYLPPAPPKPRSLAFKITIITLITLVALAPFALIFGAAYGIPAYREWYQNELIRRVHAQAPLFEDKLDYNDGKWPVGDAEDGRSYYFSNGAYHLEGQRDDRAMSAPGAALFDDDAAVEATAAQKGSATSSTGYDGVGLILRVAADGRDFVVFYVNQKGIWSLARYHYLNGEPDSDWSDLAGGYSKEIKQGGSVENRQLVIMRGASYFCFVNGHYLGPYRDTGPELHGEREGFYLNISSVEGIFTDFAVYPAPSTDVFA
jgi:hypothetical protein